LKKEVVAPGKLRYEWLKKITKNYDKVTVSDFEINQEMPTPSIVTVEHFAKKYNKIHFIIGSDNVEKLHLWKDFKKLDAMVEWIVATRGDYDCKEYKTLQVAVEISATSLREKLKEQYIPKEIYKR